MGAYKQRIILSLVLVIGVELCWSNPWDGMAVYCNRESYKVKVSKPGCAQESVQTEACLGVCRSYVKLISHHPYVQNLCQCCKATRTVKKQFSLSSCDQGVDPTIFVDSAEECACHTISCL